MNLALIATVFLIILVLGYKYYSRFLAAQLGISDQKITPAHKQKDGIDFVPTKPFYLFAQHFSAISAAGPIAGPILACLLWGWLPCLIWIAVGVVIIGATHDFATMTASVRHGGVSIAEIASEHLGKRAGLAMMLFIWLALIYVIVAFTDITAASFVGITEELEILRTSLSPSAQAITKFNPGGAVAFAAILYLSLSLIMGLITHWFNPPLWLTTVIFVPLAFGAVYLGTKFSTLLILDSKTWCALILAYCLLASLMPVWLLLQPRGYLGGFFLFAVLLVGAMGLFFGDFEIKQAAFKTYDSGQIGGSLFPFLFVTIACGACSGFHGLVCSGTTSKQIDKESHMRPIGYGAMLCEAFVALIALVTVMIFSPSEIAGLKPGSIYGKGIGEFIALLVGPEYLVLASTFGAMAFSTFVFDTLDVCTRLGRYLIQELLGWRSQPGALFGSALTIGLPMLFVLLGTEGAYIQFWTLFGASNQLLAALSLSSISIWLYQSNKPTAFTLIPMLFILFITLWALGDIAITNLQNTQAFSVSLINGLVALVLILLALFLTLSALLKIKTKIPLYSAQPD